VAAAKQVTGTIPIVFVEVGDPVGYGIVASLTRPGGNVTGLSNNLYEYAPRSLRLFKDIAPGASRVAILCPAHNTGAGEWIKSMEAVSQALDMVPRVYHANTADELRRVLPGIDARTDVLVAARDRGYLLHRGMIIAAAMALKIPVVCQQPEFVLEGALSFDPNRVELYRRLAYYVDAVLKGARPSDLPVEEPAKSWLMINLRTAKVLGIEIPGPILMRADQVIE
jgi:putative ABC transport system substrate-binding protein